MGIYTVTDEYTSGISPARLFKALVTDSHNLIPKLLPQVVKSIEIIQGDGGAGSIRQIHFAEGIQVNSVKNRIDELNEETFAFNYTMIEGDDLKDKFEFIGYEFKFEATADGGSKNKMTIKFHTKGDIKLSEEEIKVSKEKTLGIYKLVETYLLQNPDVYA